jgi:hypothetical protein
VKVRPIQSNLGFFLPIRKHVPLKEVVSWLKRGQYVPFLREKQPFKKVTPKAGANIGVITGILLTAGEKRGHLFRGYISLKN